MSSVAKIVKPRTSVMERTKQFETLSHPTEAPDEEQEGLAFESDDDDEGLDFAALVKNITGSDQSIEGVASSDALKEAFKILDYDEDGFISVSDLRTALKMFGDDDLEGEGEEMEGKNPGEGEEEEDEEDEATLHEMIAEADLDGDGQISFDDFIHVLTKPDEPEVLEPVEEEGEMEKKTKKKHRKHPR